MLPGARFALSWDGRSWEEAGSDLDRFFGPAGPARYVYYLRCQLSTARLRKLSINNDLQMAPLTLPGMAIGKNMLTYIRFSVVGERKVRLTPLDRAVSVSSPRGAGGTYLSTPRWRDRRD